MTRSYFKSCIAKKNTSPETVATDAAQIAPTVTGLVIPKANAVESRTSISQPTLG
jgi:hypothetical protein